MMADSKASKHILEKKSSFPLQNSPDHHITKATEVEGKIVDTNKKYQHMSQSMGGNMQNIRGLTVQTRMNPLMGGNN
jgi:hypothetical protein